MADQQTHNKDPRIGTSFNDMLTSMLQDARFAQVYINEALRDFIEDEEEWEFFLDAVHHVARAKGISNTARLMGVSRQSLSNMLNSGSKPSALRLFKLLVALNLKVEVKAVEPDESTFMTAS